MFESEVLFYLSIVATLALAAFSFYRFKTAMLGTFQRRTNGPGSAVKKAKKVFWVFWVLGVVIGFKVPWVGVLLLWAGAIGACFHLYGARKRLCGRR